MIKKMLAILLLLISLPVASQAETIVTSFYPIWLFTLNLVHDLPDVTVYNLAAPDTGCLHDYQLQTADMKVLSAADAFLVNGAGMESFLPQIESSFHDLPVIDACAGIPLLSSVNDTMFGEAETEYNAHVWLNPLLAEKMVQNLADGLSGLMPAHREKIQQNCLLYIDRLTALHETLLKELKEISRKDIITFHEAFPYFAAAYDLHVVAVVNQEPGETLSPSQMSDLIGIIRQYSCPPLFIEPQYDDMSARTLAAETGAQIYILDPVVTGPEKDVPLDYYENVMVANMSTLKEALQ